MAHDGSHILGAVISTSKIGDGLAPLSIGGCMAPRSSTSGLSRASGDTLASFDEPPLTVQLDDEVLGSGQYATVRLGRLSTGGACAVKIAHKQDPDAVELAQIEAAALARVGGAPATVQCFGVVDLGVGVVEPWGQAAERMAKGQGQWGVVLELCHGSCWELMQRSRAAMGAELFFAWARQLTLALAALRSAGMAHKDIKPHNILLDRAGEVRLADFTAAEFSPAAVAAMRVTCEAFNPNSYPPYVDFSGTVPYSAPEALSPGLERTAQELHKIDVFSLGVTLYALFVSGRDPFASVKSGLEQMLLAGRGAFWEWEERQALAATPSAPQEASGGLARSLSLGRRLRRRQASQEFRTFLSGEPLPAGVEALLRAMTSPNPDQRPDASAILQALDEMELEIFEP